MDARSNKALDLFAQLAPPEALARARELALQIGRDEYVKDYISRRAPLVAAVGMATTGGFGAAMIVLLGKLSPLLPAFAPWQRIAVFVFAVVAWAACTVFVMYLFLSSMRRAAIAGRSTSQGECDGTAHQPDNARRGRS